MVPDITSNTLVPFDFQYLLDKIPEITQLGCSIHTDSLDRPIDSSNIKPEHWLRLANRISFDYDKYDGFVILHGSDTMAYTASALSFIFNNLAKPVVMTGSQLPIGVARSDARENLLTTIEIAMARRKDGLAMVPEVCIYFENDLYRGNRTHKISTEDFEAFESMNYPRLAEAGVNIKFNETFIHRPPKDPFEISQIISNEVGILTVFPGQTEEYVKSVLNNNKMKALILRSFGSGNAPMDRWFLDALRESVSNGVHIINISQCVGGGIALGKYEASKEMRDMGVISGSDMTFEAGLTKAMYLLGKQLTHADFKKQYETNLRGELSN